jgi:hypothetical protein
VDFGYSRPGFREQDLVLLRHNLITNSSDLPFGNPLIRQVWDGFLNGNAHTDGLPNQAVWDLFELRYQSFTVRSNPYRDPRSARRTLQRMYRHMQGVRRFRQWIDRQAAAYNVSP